MQVHSELYSNNIEHCPLCSYSYKPQTLFNDVGGSGNFCK